MSLKTSLLKTLIGWTPRWLIARVANFILKGIVELKQFSLDLDARQIYVELQLYGEPDTLQIWLEAFYIANPTGTNPVFVLQKARSSKPWVNNVLAKVAGKAWAIPDLPQYRAQIQLVSELLESDVAGRLPSP